MIGRIYNLRPGDMEFLTFEQLGEIADDLKRLEAAAKKAESR